MRYKRKEFRLNTEKDEGRNDSFETHMIDVPVLRLQRPCVYDQLNFTSSNEIARRGFKEHH